MSSLYEATIDLVSSRVGPLDDTWRIDVVIRDEPIAANAFNALTTRLDSCRAIEIQFASRELAYGYGDRLREPLAHEIVHAIILSRTPAWYVRDGNASVWLMEGLAVWGSDQIDRQAAILLEQHLASSWQLPDPSAWSPPGKGGAFESLDYFMSGILVSIALSGPEDVSRLVTLLARREPAADALEAVSEMTWSALLEQARQRGSDVLGRVRHTLYFDEYVELVGSSNEEGFRRFASERRDSRLAGWAQAELQKIACGDGTLAECHASTNEVHRWAWILPIWALARADGRLAGALERHGRATECAEQAWDALRRGSGALSARTVGATLERIGRCHAMAGEPEAVFQTAYVVADVLQDADVRQATLLALADVASEHQFFGELSQIMAMSASDPVPAEPTFRRTFRRKTPPATPP